MYKIGDEVLLNIPMILEYYNKNELELNKEEDTKCFINWLNENKNKIFTVKNIYKDEILNVEIYSDVYVYYREVELISMEAFNIKNLLREI